jgi:hypothetical protein
MNGGPNLISLFIIGGVAGMSAFGLYLGYKQIFNNINGPLISKKKQIRLNEILSDLSDSVFDAEKTLKAHRNNEKNRHNKHERTRRRGHKNSSKNESSNDSANKLEEVGGEIKKQKESIIPEIEEPLNELEQLQSKSLRLDRNSPSLRLDRNSPSLRLDRNSPSLRLDRNYPKILRTSSSKEVDLLPKASIINIEKNDLPKVMEKKKLSTSNEEIESLVGIPVTDGINAQHLIAEDTIRTIDKKIPEGSKKKKRCKKKKMSKSKEV